MKVGACGQAAGSYFSYLSPPLYYLAPLNLDRGKMGVSAGKAVSMVNNYMPSQAPVPPIGGNNRSGFCCIHGSPIRGRYIDSQMAGSEVLVDGSISGPLNETALLGASSSAGSWCW